VTIYEKRTYSVIVGRMPDVVRLYTETGWPALASVGSADYLVGYFTSDTGPLSQLVHLWRFADDNDRRAFWRRLAADEGIQRFLAVLRPMLQTQEVQLLNPAPWGRNP
jgi:hypothetical protein